MHRTTCPQIHRPQATLQCNHQFILNTLGNHHTPQTQRILRALASARSRALAASAAQSLQQPTATQQRNHVVRMRLSKPLATAAIALVLLPLATRVHNSTYLHIVREDGICPVCDLIEAAEHILRREWRIFPVSNVEKRSLGAHPLNLPKPSACTMNCGQIVLK